MHSSADPSFLRGKNKAPPFSNMRGALAVPRAPHRGRSAQPPARPQAALRPPATRSSTRPTGSRGCGWPAPNARTSSSSTSIFPGSTGSRSRCAFAARRRSTASRSSRSPPEGDRETSFAVGCDGFLQKPIDARSFAQQVASYIGGRRDGDVAPDATGKRLRIQSQRIVAHLEEKVAELSPRQRAPSRARRSSAPSSTATSRTSSRRR